MSSSSSFHSKKGDSNNKLEKKQQIPTEYNEEQTLRVVRKQDRITGEARNKTINDFPYAADIAQVGSSDKGWEDATQVAIDEAKKTIHGITGVEVVDMTAKVDPNTGKIIQYRACVKIAFGVEH